MLGFQDSMDIFYPKRGHLAQNNHNADDTEISGTRLHQGAAYAGFRSMCKVRLPCALLDYFIGFSIFDLDYLNDINPNLYNNDISFV